MIQCRCKPKGRKVFLDFKGNDSLALAFPPFTDSKEILLLPSATGKQQILCASLEIRDGAFTIPQCIQSLQQVPEQTYFTLIHDEEGYRVLFCLSHQDITASMRGASDGLHLCLTSGASNDAKKTRIPLIATRGQNLHETIRSAMNLALEITGGYGKLLSDKLAAPNWLNSLGWESGVAMGSNVSHENIISSVKHLVDAGFPPGFVLIDEGWQHLEINPGNKKSDKVLASFEADPVRFPRGIKGVVDDLQQLGVGHVGVWHGMMGYRGGIHPKLSKRYALPCSREKKYFLGTDLGRTFQFYYDYYGYLREQGVAFIKVGDQSSVHDFCHEEMEATLLYRNLQSAMQAAASVQFNGAHFNTECLRNENLFYWGNSRIARTAEDIDLRNPGGVARAIRNNLTNSLWLQHLMEPDFDAWLTCTDQSETLAVFHALSGSINVIGDPVGEHNKTLIDRFVLPCGQLIKADRPLTLCNDSIFIDPLVEKKIFKAFTTKGEYGIVAAFNLANGRKTLHGVVSPKDIEGLNGEKYALYSYHNGFVKIVKPDEEVAVTLKPDQSDVFTFAPVHHGIAVLGACSFILAPGPVNEVLIEEESVHISTLASTRLLMYCERQILEVRRNGRTIPWEYDSRRCTLSIDSRRCNAPGNALYSISFE